MSSAPAGATGLRSAWLVLRPLDVVTFRDGRSFTAGLPAPARTVLPRPTSTGGAVDSVLGGRRPGDPPRANEIAGPVLTRLGNDTDVLLPAPADLLAEDGEVLRLHPDRAVDSTIVTDLTGTPGPDPEFRLLAGAGQQLSAYVEGALLAEYLAGNPEPMLTALAAPGGDVFPLVREARLGLARHRRSTPGQGRTAIEGFLYLGEFWRPTRDAERDIGFGCRVWFDEALLPLASEVVPLGGERRQVQVSVILDDGPDAVAPLPPAPDDFPDGKVLLYLATPAVFTDGWLPPVPDGCRVVAASVGGPEPVAGWSPDGGARPLRWAVTAGSVYFLRFDQAVDAGRYAAVHHGRCLPQRDPVLRTAGFGMCLIGRW